MARSRATSAPAPDGDGDEPNSKVNRGSGPDGYTVVARRYRPQRFDDVVGQDHVVQALRNAIRLNRVTHAYLFSGTRGVGKTSMARIFAKCLNCAHGPTDQPCNECDICRAIGVGQDVDVIEIDGASNNGVEAVRELRQNAGLRPSRARFKIYYIDEVHMLSTGAFNALLKVLEEPPEHVKFFFATTEPGKIPATILSRVQRYDFAGIRPEQIIETLAGICAREGVEADREALQTVARRAGGSMRDAQSLLEQLLSFGNGRLTAELVHKALGLAPDEWVLDLVDALADRDPARALTLLDQAVNAGVQPTDLLAELLEFLRDVMLLAAGASAELLGAPPSLRERLEGVVRRWSLDAVLAALQILSEARGRLRGSSHGRLLVELALCRVARLEDFAELGELIGRLSALGGGDGPPPPAKKKGPAPEQAPVAPQPREPVVPPAPPSIPTPANLAPKPPATPHLSPAQSPETPVAGAVPRALSVESMREIWPDLSTVLGPPLGSHLAKLSPAALPEPGVLVVTVPQGYNWLADACEKPEARAKVEAAIHKLINRPLTVRFDRPASAAEPSGPRARPVAVRHDELEADPLVQDVVKLFEARPVRVEVEEDPEP